MAFDFTELWKLLSGSGGQGSLVGAGIKTGATAYGGIEADRAARYSADSAEVSAGQAIAASHFRAQNELKRSQLIASRAQALAAASGAGASDQTVTKIIADIAGEGAYRSELALYEGKEASRALMSKADVLRYQGKSAKAAGAVNALTGFGGTFFEKYGGGGPKGMGYGTIDPTQAGYTDNWSLPY